MNAPATARRWLPWPGMRNLPRETRDTLFLLGVIAWVIAPHTGQLPLWCSLLAGVVLLARARLALTGAALPGGWVLAGLLLVAVGATWLSHRTLLGKEAGVTLVVVLITLKTLELRARRDAFVIFFLGFFLVLTHFLYSQSLLVALGMLVAVWGLLTALVLAHMPVGQPTLAAAGGIAARMTAFGAPVMAALFLLFPRVGPLWGLPQDATAGRTGLSNSMALGDVAELALDDRIAMRLRFDGPPPAPSTLYFRGPVLSRFDGREWRPSPGGFRASPPADEAPRVEGPGFAYELTLEPSSLPVLPLLEMTAEAPAVEELPLWRGRDLTWRALRPPMERVRLRARAHPRFSHGPLQPVHELQEHLDLPPGFNPRTLAWAAQMRREPRFATADADTLADALLSHVRSQPYRYTLSPGIYGDERGRHAIDEFWLDRREGFCEHYAAAFVVVMRALGVPARVVTGYQGAEFNPVDGYWLVRQSHAHAWAEYWQPGRGWVRADPTAAVAPDRIEHVRALSPPPGMLTRTLGFDPSLLQRLRHTFDAIDNGWNQWVLNYSRGQQLELLKGLGFRSRGWEHLGLLLAGLTGGTALLGVAWALWDRHRQDPWLRALGHMQRALQGAGLEVRGPLTPRRLAEQALARWGTAAQPAAAALFALEALRYAPDGPGSAAAGRRAATLVREFRRALQQVRAPALPSRS
ncbi:transglutaminaseTgpA domain-containing protein [Caldimonas tepidiphila]|uniref:transglutaminase family protein n=1 Tax=Caldimonas tepidiphila TaxID=2315841 RepID=UPI000E5BED96|nr:DUF3488 and transglutaminase-like domain-containing protein [Caldimonas tepidiphila]